MLCLLCHDLFLYPLSGQADAEPLAFPGRRCRNLRALASRRNRVSLRAVERLERYAAKHSKRLNANFDSVQRVEQHGDFAKLERSRVVRSPELQLQPLCDVVSHAFIVPADKVRAVRHDVEIIKPVQARS